MAASASTPNQPIPRLPSISHPPSAIPSHGFPLSPSKCKFPTPTSSSSHLSIRAILLSLTDPPLLPSSPLSFHHRLITAPQLHPPQPTKTNPPAPPTKRRLPIPQSQTDYLRKFCTAQHFALPPCLLLGLHGETRLDPSLILRSRPGGGETLSREPSRQDLRDFFRGADFQRGLWRDSRLTEGEKRRLGFVEGVWGGC